MKIIHCADIHLGCALADLGREKSEELADYYCGLCLKLLNEMPYESGFLQALTQYVRKREA